MADLSDLIRKRRSVCSDGLAQMRRVPAVSVRSMKSVRHTWASPRQGLVPDVLDVLLASCYDPTCEVGGEDVRLERRDISLCPAGRKMAIADQLSELTGG